MSITDDASHLLALASALGLERERLLGVDEVLEDIGKQDTRIVHISITPAEKIARVIESFPVSGILMGLGLLGLWIEFKTPGFGFPGIAGLICLALWFWGHNIAGLSGSMELVLFALGIVLLLLEIFVVPGFGVTGISGLVLLFTAILLSMVGGLPNREFDIPVTFVQLQWEKAFINMGIAAVLSAGLAITLARYLPSASAFRHLALQTEMTRENGYQSSDEHDDMIGQRGTAVTTLRPAGIGQFGSKRMNVVSCGTFIDKDASIVIAEAHGNRIVVEEVG